MGLAIEVVTTEYGPAALAALRQVVADAKRGDPLSPVTLLVPNNLCGVSARRALARGYRGGRPGVAGLSVSTLPRLAEKLAAPTLTGAGRRPLTTPLLGAAWRQALAANPGPLAPVASHPATVRAVVAAYRELRDLSEPALDAVAATSELSAQLVALYHSVAKVVAGRWYDTVDLLRAAAQVPPPAGSVVLFLPQELGRSAADLLHTLPAVSVVAGLTGQPRADEAVTRTLEAFGHENASVPSERVASRVLHASDPDDEVRCVVREVVRALARVPAYRVAVLYASASPYARLLHEHLSAAGVNVNGVGVRRGDERSIGRGLLDLLALPDHEFRRDEVFRVLAGAPVRTPDGGHVPTASWERISRAAGVVKGDDWQARLVAYTEAERKAAATERAADDPSEAWAARNERNATAADALRKFATDLADELREGVNATTWAELGPWALNLFRRAFGDESARTRMPREEANAAGLVERVLGGLAGLAAIEPRADLGLLREVVELELAESLPRVGRSGEGVAVGPVSSAVGLDADVVYVVGLAEDLYPGRHREESLLPDRVRAATGGELPAFRERFDRQHRELLAAFAAAPDVVATFPRGDLHGHGHRLPSRWLLPTLRLLSGERQLVATEWHLVAARPWLASSPSYAGSLRTTGLPATEQEWRLRTLAAGRPIDDGVHDAAVAMTRARAGDAFTRYDGNLAHLDLPAVADGKRLVSPTSLEGWAYCPHAYFLQRMLRVEPVETPAEVLQISPLDIGSLVHETFDAFVKEMTDVLPAPGQAWSPGQRARLLELANEHAAAYEQRGVTGHPRLWQQERARILADLAWMLDADDEWRATRRAELLSSEMAFGLDGEEPVSVRLPDGSQLLFRGKADRVDRASDGTLIVVDLKTGSTRSFKNIGEADPVVGGTKLQLPVYAYAARQRYGDDDTPVEAAYWFVRKDRGTRVSLPLTAAVRQVYAETLATIADGIAGGIFPQRPSKDPSWGAWVDCPYCDPDGLGHSDARARWERKRLAPALEAYVRLAEPAALESEEA